MIRSTWAFGFVDLVDGDDDRDFSSPRMVDGLKCLRHDAIVGRHYQHYDIGYFGAAGTHAGKRFVTGRIDENDLISVLLDVICTDVLRDAAGFFACDIRQANSIQQRGFTVIHVAHNGDHGRTANKVLIHLRHFHTCIASCS